MTARRIRREERPPRALTVQPDAPAPAGPAADPASPPGPATDAEPSAPGGRPGGAGQRTRVRKARKASTLSCGHHVGVGALIVSHSRGPWVCVNCSLARSAPGGSAPSGRGDD